MTYATWLRALTAIVVLVPSAFGGSYRFGEVWDGYQTQKNVCVNIQGEKIQSVRACPADAVDMSRFAAIPGMIDVHTHLTYVQENPVAQSARGAAVVYLAAANAKKTLDAGVTTVRDLGAQNYSDIVAVEGDPLADIGIAIDKVRWVMKAGAVVVDKTSQALR